MRSVEALSNDDVFVDVFVDVKSCDVKSSLNTRILGSDFVERRRIKKASISKDNTPFDMIILIIDELS